MNNFKILLIFIIILSLLIINLINYRLIYDFTNCNNIQTILYHDNFVILCHTGNMTNIINI